MPKTFAPGTMSLNRSCLLFLCSFLMASVVMAQEKEGAPEKKNIAYWEKMLKDVEIKKIENVPDGKMVQEYENGSPKILTFFRNGYMDSILTIYYENGNKYYEGHIEDRKLTGTERQWYDNGNLLSVTQYENGLKQDTCKMYHKNGKIWVKGRYESGRLTGTWKDRYNNGQLKEISRFDEGLPVGEKIKYYRNGQKKMEGQFNKTHQKDGKWIYWLENGQKVKKETYKDGELVDKSYF